MPLVKFSAVRKLLLKDKYACKIRRQTLCMRKLMLTVVVVILQQISSSQLNEFLKTVMEAFHRRSEYLNCLKTVNRPPSNVALTGQTSGGWTSQSPLVVVAFEQLWSF